MSMTEKILPISGEIFDVDGHKAFLITPSKRLSTDSVPWVWYAPTLPGLPGAEERWMFQKFLDVGIAIAGIDIGESYGCPKGRAIFSVFYRELIHKQNFSKKPCLLARSRGGLMLYNWAVENPLSVSCIAGIYPVCNLQSYTDLKEACASYEMTEEQLLSKHNPIDRLEPLAKANVPIFHINGDSDTVVPLETNSGELLKRYHQLGCMMTLRVVNGQGHDMWPGWFQCRELIDFVIRHAGIDTSCQSIPGNESACTEL